MYHVITNHSLAHKGLKKFQKIAGSRDWG